MKPIAVVILALALIRVRESGANFLAYDDDTTTNDPDEDYIQDEDLRRADYHDAMDRLISHALNQTHDGKGKSATDLVKAAPDVIGDDELKCAGNRQPVPVSSSAQITVNKCCPSGETFLHESLARCKVPMRRSRLPIVSREVHLYDQSCYKFGHYLKHNITVNGKCIGKRLVFNDETLFTIIQNGSLLVSSRSQMAIFNDFCVEETGSTVLAAYVCDEISLPDPFDLVDKIVIGMALVALFVTILIYGFERNFRTTFGMMVMAHVGMLFGALLLEAALTEFYEAYFSTIVYILIGTSYVMFATANLHCLMTNQGNYQKMDIRNLAFVAFGCCILWLISALFTLYYNERLVTLCTIFICLVLSVVLNVIILRGIIGRRHHLLTSMENCYEISDSTEYSSYVHHRKELTILSTFSAILQLLHWILFAANRYSLLYGLSWCGLTVFAVFVCFRYRSITVLSGGSSSNSISKVLRHHHHQQQQQYEEPSDLSPQENGYNQRPPNSPLSSHHQQQDNQKHTLTPVAEEDGLHDGGVGVGDDGSWQRSGKGLNEVESGA